MTSQYTETLEQWLTQLKPNAVLLSSPVNGGISWSFYEYCLPTGASIILFILTVITLFCFYKHYRNQITNNYLIKQCNYIKEQYYQHKNEQLTITHYNAFLKQIMTQYYPETMTSVLYGEKWLSFLDLKSQSRSFTKGAGRHLGNYYDNTELAPENIESLSVCVNNLLQVILAGRHGDRNG